jgi:hypothetical protein
MDIDLHGLRAHEREAIAFVIRANAEVALSGLRSLPAGDPHCAMCLWPQDVEDALDAYPISLCTQADRRALLAGTAGRERVRAAWNPMEFTIEGLPDEFDVRSCDGFDEEERIAAAALIAREVADPPRWTLDRAARQVTRDTPRELVTPDFVCFTLDPDFSSALLESLRFAAPPPVVAMLSEAGLMPDEPPEAAEL